MKTHLENLVDDLEDYIHGCGKSIFGNKIQVDISTIDEMIQELRDSIPDEIKKYHKMVSNQNAILQNAKDQADKIMYDARQITDRMINESEIMRQAYNKAQGTVVDAQSAADEIISSARAEADKITLNAIKYTDEMLANLSSIIQTTAEDTGNRFNQYIQGFQSAIDNLQENRRMLAPSLQEADARDAVAAANMLHEEESKEATEETAEEEY